MAFKCTRAEFLSSWNETLRCAMTSEGLEVQHTVKNHECFSASMLRATAGYSEFSNFDEYLARPVHFHDHHTSTDSALWAKTDDIKVYIKISR